MLATPVAELRVDLGTSALCQGATTIEPAADWRIDGARYLSAQGEAWRGPCGIG